MYGVHVQVGRRSLVMMMTKLDCRTDGRQRRSGFDNPRGSLKGEVVLNGASAYHSLIQEQP
jgi:hypothetical protein